MDWTQQLFMEAVWRHITAEIGEDEEKSADFKRASYEALRIVRMTAAGYVENSVLFWLSLRIFYKKGCMIKQAATKIELNEIVKPSVPRESCGVFREGPYHVHEEEMILWSKTSLEAPLNEHGYKRYMKVFSMFFPKEAKEIFGLAVN